jgi:hypothetical protein
MSVDPLTKKYPELTPYQFASNTPIVAVDLDGLEMLRYDETLIDLIMGGTSLNLTNAHNQTKNRYGIFNKMKIDKNGNYNLEHSKILNEANYFFMSAEDLRKKISGPRTSNFGLQESINIRDADIELGSYSWFTVNEEFNRQNYNESEMETMENSKYAVRSRRISRGLLAVTGIAAGVEYFANSQINSDIDKAKYQESKFGELARDMVLLEFYDNPYVPAIVKTQKNGLDIANYILDGQIVLQHSDEETSYIIKFAKLIMNRYRIPDRGALSYKYTVTDNNLRN